jgi:ATP dependent DNA ligase domain/ATP dependent DNA ligase C terminal region/DNA ligase IV
LDDVARLARSARGDDALGIGKAEQTYHDALREINSGGSTGKQYCFMAFDMLYTTLAKGPGSIMSYPLHTRQDALQRSTRHTEHMFECVTPKRATTMQEVVSALDDAILRRQEGIVIKNIESEYTPGQRKNNWLKLKPEYERGVGDDMDLLVVGGYYSTGVHRNRGGKVTHFMLGVGVLTPEQQAQAGTGVVSPHPQKYLSFAKVGSGFSDQDIDIMERALKDRWEEFDPARPPSWLDLGTTKPEVIVKPANSVIVQVKAAEIIHPTTEYASGYTLRFPRAEKIRTDKDWFEGMMFHELETLHREVGGRHAKRRLGEIDASKSSISALKRAATKAAKARQQRPVEIPAHLRGADAGTLAAQARVSDLFGGLEFCVLTGFGDEDRVPSHTKSAIETAVVAHGGACVQNPPQAETDPIDVDAEEEDDLLDGFESTLVPGSDGKCVLLAGKMLLRVRNLVRKNAFDIVNPSWLEACVQERRLLPLEPRFMQHTTPRLRKQFALEMDRFGDKFYSDATVQSLRETLDDNIQLVVAPNGEIVTESRGIEIGAASVIKTEADDTVKREGDPRSSHRSLVTDELDVIRVHRQMQSLLWGDTNRAPWFALFREHAVYVDRYLDVGNLLTAKPDSPLIMHEEQLRYYGAHIVTEIPPPDLDGEEVDGSAPLLEDEPARHSPSLFSLASQSQGDADHMVAPDQFPSAPLTHVVMDMDDLRRLRAIRELLARHGLTQAVSIVDKEWVTQCVSHREDRSETPYLVDALLRKRTDAKKQRRRRAELSRNQSRQPDTESLA